MHVLATGRPLSLVSIAERARQAPLNAFEDLLGAQYFLVGAEHERRAEDDEWSYSTAKFTAPRLARDADLIGEAVAFPIRKARPDVFPVTVLVGRAASNDVRIDSRSVSKLHARIRLIPGGLAISDAGSRNGTTLNGRAVTTEVALAPRDIVAFGYRSFTVEHVSTLHGALRRAS